MSDMIHVLVLCHRRQRDVFHQSSAISESTHKRGPRFQCVDQR